VLVRDVAYAGLPKAERAELHQRHADWLDGQPDRSDELVGYHLEQAAGYLGELGAPEQQVTRIATNAGRRLGAAGITAWKRGDAPAVAGLLARAVALLPAGDEFRLELLCELGGARRTLGELVAAERTYAEARAEAEVAGQQRIERRAAFERVFIALSIDSTIDPQELLESTGTAIPVLEAYGDERALGRAFLLRASALGPYQSHYAAAGKAVEQAIHHYKRSDWPFSACLATLGSSLVNGPTPVADALRVCAELLREADLNGQANMLSFIATLEAMQGQFDRARQRTSRAREIFIELGQPIGAEYSCGEAEARIELLAGSPDRAYEALKQSYAALAARGERSYLATRAAMLADVLYRQERWAEADRRAKEAQACSSRGDVLTEWMWRSVAGRLAARAGRLEEGAELVHGALACLADTDVLDQQARCRLDLADVLCMARRGGEARACVAEAIRLFELKGNDIDAKRAAAWLAKLTESP